MAGSGGNRTIRVLTICPQLTTGGAETQLLLFCRCMDPERFHVTVLFYEEAGRIYDDLRAGGVPVIHLDRGRLGAPGLLRALRREIRDRRPDVLDCRLPSAYRFGRLAAAGLGLPAVVAEERTVMNDSLPRRLVDRLCNRWTDAWVANSRSVADHLVQDVGAAREKVHVIYNGLETDRFVAGAGHPLLERLRAGGRRIVLNVSNMRLEAKNHRLFLRVCERLGRERSDLAFALCGDGPLRPSLEQYAEQVGVSQHCHFLGFQEDIRPVLRSADLLVQSSDYEGFPNALMEAMAAGVPVVATDAGGTRELVDDGADGYVVPVGDEDALVRRSLAVLDDARLAERIGAAARRRIGERFSAEAMASQYADLFERLLSAKGSGGTAQGAPRGGRTGC